MEGKFLNGLPEENRFPVWIILPSQHMGRLSKMKNLKIDRLYWIYGLIMGLLLIVLQIVQYKTILQQIRLELAVAVIGILFLGLGIWFGSKLLKASNEKINASELGLSEREMEVLQLLSEGYSNKEIADRLFVSLNTIKTHLSNIYSKMGVNRRTQAVQKARQFTY